jgi:molybdate transport system substrate-binding protein
VRRIGAAVLAAGLLALAGCGAADAGGEARSSTVTVFAAASLKDSFTELGHRFEAEHEGAAVTFNFAGSSDLVSQLQQGAPADVFASADTRNMAKAAADELLAGDPVTFASNTLEIAVPPDDPAGVGSFADLARPGLRLVVCAPEVPCGAATRRVEQVAGLALHPVSEESSVTDVLNKVVTGEADAGLVYRTDVRSAGKRVKGIAFPESAQAVNEYPIAVLADSGHADLARQFVDLVTGPQGRQVLTSAGFSEP